MLHGFEGLLRQFELLLESVLPNIPARCVSINATNKIQANKNTFLADQQSDFAAQNTARIVQNWASPTATLTKTEPQPHPRHYNNSQNSLCVLDCHYGGMASGLVHEGTTGVASVDL